MTSERIDLLERGDNFAPATIRVNWSGTANVGPNSTTTLPITGSAELSGNIFEYLSSSQALRIKQAGIIGFSVDVLCGTNGNGNVRVMMRQASPTHDWAMVQQPYYTQPAFAFLSGGVRFVDVPADGANYQIWVMNSGGGGTVTLYAITIRLVYLGRR